MKPITMIVGGGIAGIFSALLHAKKGANVTLIEQNEDLGGLFKSKEKFAEKVYYDYGTHFLRETGIDEVDDLLFSNLEYKTFDYLKTGSFYNKLYSKNGFLSDDTLVNRDQLFQDLKKKRNDNSNNLEEQLIYLFGEMYSKELLIPIIEKFFFTEVKNLAKDSHLLFGLSRIVAGSSIETNLLKEQKKYDQVLAFHSYKEGLSSSKSLYPKSKGVGAWIDSLKQELLRENVNIITKADIQNIEIESRLIKKMTINNEVFLIDKLIWTVPPFILLGKLNIKTNDKPPKRLTSYIFHYLVDKKYLTDLYYIHCYDTKLKSFRITLYDNYSKGIEDKYRISVEVLTEKESKNIPSFQDEIFSELITMNIIPKNTSVINQDFDYYPNGFPVLTESFNQVSKKQIKQLINNFDNIEIYGKSKGKCWFMNDIILDIYNSTV